MLRDNGIIDVQVISVEGQLTDHYNPEQKTVNLSPDVFHGRSAAAAAVAAHECGHAVQHLTGYKYLTLRSAMVPVQNISSKVINFIFLAIFNQYITLYQYQVSSKWPYTLYLVLSICLPFD